MMLLPRPVPALLVALALATCALASTSAAQSTSSDEQHLVVAQRPGTSLSSALAVRHLTPADLKLRRTTQDGGGRRHHRYRQTFNGLDVIGGDLVVHADAQGSIYAINGTRARRPSRESRSARHRFERRARASCKRTRASPAWRLRRRALVYLITPEGATLKAYEIVAEGERAQTPVRDKVYVDVDSGTVVGVHPQIHFAMNRSVYSANNGTSLPGTLRRTEGQAATTDLDVNAAYDNTGDTYDAYKNFWNRDSYNNAGAHAQEHGPLLHQLLQRVLERHADGLRRRQRRPGLLAARARARRHRARAHPRGDRERVRPDLLRRVGRPERGVVRHLRRVHARRGSTAADRHARGLRRHLDGRRGHPAAGTALHERPGRGRRVARLLDQRRGQRRRPLQLGHRQPRLLPAVAGRHAPARQVDHRGAGIGMEKAIRIFYEANVNYLTPSSNFAAARNASVKAATELGYDAGERNAVADAWRAVGRASPGGGPGPAHGDTVLTNGVPVTGTERRVGQRPVLQARRAGRPDGLAFRLSGGTGDADMYVRFGTRPTTDDVRLPSVPQRQQRDLHVHARRSGTYYVMLHGYAAYSA